MEEDGLLALPPLPTPNPIRFKQWALGGFVVGSIILVNASTTAYTVIYDSPSRAAREDARALHTQSTFLDPSRMSQTPRPPLRGAPVRCAPAQAPIAKSRRI